MAIPLMIQGSCGLSGAFVFGLLTTGCRVFLVNDRYSERQVSLSKKSRLI